MAHLRPANRLFQTIPDNETRSSISSSVLRGCHLVDDLETLLRGPYAHPHVQGLQPPWNSLLRRVSDSVSLGKGYCRSFPAMHTFPEMVPVHHSNLCYGHAAGGPERHDCSGATVVFSPGFKRLKTVGQRYGDWWSTIMFEEQPY